LKLTENIALKRSSLPKSKFGSKEEKRKSSLAERNIKINFASGLKDFIKFKIKVLKLRGNTG